MRAAKIFITVFLVVLFFYVTVFTIIEHRRVTNGPWEVMFTTNSLVINQPRLGLTNIQISLEAPALAAATNLPTTLLFELNTPTPYAVPGGQCVFLDLLYQPGTVALELGGHQIQLMPRTLTVDHREIAWANNSVLKLAATVK